MNRFSSVWISGLVVVLGFIFALALLFAFKMVLAWTNPTQSPPGGSGTGIIPAGQVAFFNLSSCPSGWTELTSARGRYIVGLPSAGTLAGTAGTALSNLESRAVGQHTHTITDPGHSHSFGYSVPTTDGSVLNTNLGTAPGVRTITGTQSAGTGITINNAGSVSGTNAPYIQLLACQKS